VLFIGALILTSFLIIRPFLAAIVWAAMIVIATWPIMLWIQGRLWNSRPLAVTVMVAVLVLMIELPVSLAIFSVIGNADDIGANRGIPVRIRKYRDRVNVPARTEAF
jgi:predicted PurR-regulated permease PerM